MGRMPLPRTSVLRCAFPGGNSPALADRPPGLLHFLTP